MAAAPSVDRHGPGAPILAAIASSMPLVVCHWRCILSPSALVPGCTCYRRAMSSPVQHRWDLSPAEAQALQQELRRRVVADDDFGPVRFVAGVDNTYVPATATTCAGVVVLSWPELTVVERQVSRTPTTFPYVP